MKEIESKQGLFRVQLILGGDPDLGTKIPDIIIIVSILGHILFNHRFIL